jgi:hypothetical protein
MANSIREIGKFSDDATHIAMATVFENQSDAKQEFEVHFRAIAAIREA